MPVDAAQTTETTDEAAPATTDETATTDEATPETAAETTDETAETDEAAAEVAQVTETPLPAAEEAAAPAESAPASGGGGFCNGILGMPLGLGVAFLALNRRRKR